MYQELIVFVDSFESRPVWGTEANDLPLPALAVGDVLDVPTLREWAGATPTVWRVTAVKHVFTAMGDRTPEADHQVLVTVREDKEPTLEQELEQAEVRNEELKQHSQFWQTLLGDIAEQQAPALRDALLTGIEHTMKRQPAHGIAEARNEWCEAATIVQADGHMLEDMLTKQLRGSIHQALQRLPREERLLLWLEQGGLHEEWETSAQPQGFEPDGRSDALDRLQETLLRRLQTRLLNTALD